LRWLRDLEAERLMDLLLLLVGVRRVVMRSALWVSALPALTVT
jgi:hypothetical protein